MQECQVIQRAMGKTCIPTEPQRIVTLDIFSLGNALTLGINPIASSASSWAFVDGLPSYLQKRTQQIEFLGNECQPNLEKILRLQPDLIIGRTACIKNPIFLSKIAPVVLSNWRGGSNWREDFAFMTEVLGQQQSAKKAWTHYYQRIEKLNGILAKQYQNKKISVIDITSGIIHAHTKNSFSGSILSDVELERPDSQNITPDLGYTIFSEEELDKIDGDVLFLLVGRKDDREYIEKLQQKPLWKKLRVAQTNRVYLVKNYIWWGGTLLAADAVLDDLEKYLINAP